MYLPANWTVFTHPERQAYLYRNAGLRVVTEACIYRPEIMDKASSWTSSIENALKDPIDLCRRLRAEDPIDILQPALDDIKQTTNKQFQRVRTEHLRVRCARRPTSIICLMNPFAFSPKAFNLRCATCRKLSAQVRFLMTLISKNSQVDVRGCTFNDVGGDQVNIHIHANNPPEAYVEEVQDIDTPVSMFIPSSYICDSTSRLFEGRS